MYKLPAESTAAPIGLSNWALVAGPLSPLKPDVPFPATTAINPFETFQMRLLASSVMYRLPAESTATPDGSPNECLSRLILFGESSLRRAVTAFAEHCHRERNHQGKENVLLFPAAEQRVGSRDGKVRCKERLGGLLK
jgi:hypothetical protein